MGRGESTLSKVQSAVERLQFRDAISAAASAPKSKLTTVALMDAVLTAAAGLWDNSDDELKAYDLVVRMGDSLPQAGNPPESVQARVNNALFNKGVVLGLRGRGEEAIAVYDDVVDRSGDSSDPGVRENTARALFNKANSLFRTGRHTEAIPVYDELATRFATDTTPALREAVGRALVNKGISLARLGEYEQAIDVFDEVASGWTDRSVGICQRAAKALINKASALIRLDRKVEAAWTYDAVVAQFGGDNRPELREYVDLANEGRQRLSRDLD